MPQYDPLVPTALKELQTWFGGIIAEPLTKEGGIRERTPQKKPIQEEAKRYIVKSPTLEPFQRIEIYNQQYWWRLVNTLQDFFPFLVRLFGYTDFNQKIAIPYILKHRPSHWSLNGIGKKLPGWVKKEYKGKDKQLVHDASLLDSAFLEIFFLKKLPPIDIADAQSATLKLQPHVLLFKLPYDLFSFRMEMNGKPPEHWGEHPFPKLAKGESYFRLYRDARSNVAWTKIDKTEYLILEQFKKGSTLDSLCDWLEQRPEKIHASAEASLEDWFKEWTVHGILTANAS